MMKTLHVIIIITVVLFACEEKDTFYADAESSFYLGKFEAEAGKRGININWAGLKVHKFDPNNSDVHPSKSHYDPNNHEIWIDTVSSNYKSTREELYMHELGHAILKRMEHDYTRLPNKMYKSVMGNFSDSYYSGWSYRDDIMYRAEYYYDELFNPNTPAPDWALN